MKGLSLRKTAVLSAGLHMMFFLLSFLVLRQSREMVMPSPYVVSLVGPSGQTQEKGAAAEPSAPAPVEKSQTVPRAPQIDEKKETKSIEDSIAALKAKKKTEEKLKKMLALRKAVLSIQRGRAGTGGKSSSQNAVAGSALSAGEASYVDKVGGQIHDQWRWPDYGKQDLQAVISVKIQKDGTLSDVRFEQRSGDRFFDRSVLDAIQKASTVASPPYEMEIGIRFCPGEKC